MSTAQDIVDKIDALILAKLSGAKGAADVADRALEGLSITWSTSLAALKDLRDFYARRADYEEGLGGEAEMIVVE